MHSTRIIQRAFQDPAEWIAFLRVMRLLFPDSRIEAIHYACTVSAGHAFLLLNRANGYPFATLYDDALQLFSAPSQLRLSPILELSSYDTFVDSLQLMEARLDVLFSILRLEQLCSTR